MIYALAAAGWLCPRPVVLILLVPVLSVLSNREMLDPVLSLGGADIRPSDFLLIVAGARIFTDCLTRRSSPVLPVSFFVLVGAFAFSTARSTEALGEAAFHFEISAFLRFVAEGFVAILLANSLWRPRDFRLFLRCWRALGILMALSVLVDVVLGQFGISLGEVQAGRITTRYLGQIGDPVAFILPLFFFTSLLTNRYAEAAVMGVAFLATGTRGPLLTIAIGFATLALWRQRALLGRHAVGILGILVALVGVFVADFGGLRSRLLDPVIFEEGALHRSSSYAAAVDVFLQHPLLGVGYMGFNLAASREYAPSFVTGTYNQWLQVLTDGGILGLAAFILVVVSIGRTLARSATVSRPILGIPLTGGFAWFVGLVLGNQTAAWMLPGSVIAYLVWCLWGAALAARAMPWMRAPRLVEAYENAADEVTDEVADDDRRIPSPAISA